MNYRLISEFASKDNRINNFISNKASNYYVYTDLNDDDNVEIIGYICSVLEKSINSKWEIQILIHMYLDNIDNESVMDWNISPCLKDVPTIHIDCRDKIFDIPNSSFHGYRILDSSIWNYAIKLDDIERRIENIIIDINNNYITGLYNLAVAHEYKDLQFRVLKNDYLLDMGGHGKDITPFIFHSEEEMRIRSLYKLAKDPCNNDVNVRLTKQDFLHKSRWRFLLVDDHDISGMTLKEGNKTSEYSKARIIINDLKRCQFDQELAVACRKISKKSKRDFSIDIIEQNELDIFEHDIIIDCVSSNKDAIELLLGQKVDDEKKLDVKVSNKAYRYDVILLDYKLGEVRDEDRISKPKEEQKGQGMSLHIEYGYELLRKIHEVCEVNDRVAGPNGTFYFMFISAYTTAVQERLQMEGFYVSKDYWFLGRGACPTNTPYLFLYCLKRMMDIRYDKLTKHSKQLLKDLKKDKDKNYKIEDYSSMSQFLTLLYQDGNERNNCVVGFNAFLNLRRVYNTVKYDIDEKEPDKGSPLINSLFPDVVVCTNSFWEHLQNLVYLTAYGTIRQWPEMWEDYTFVKQKLEAAEKLCKDRISGEPASVLIRNYILKLKESMS